MIKGLVSTIIPVYNRPRLLREAVSSVLAQTYPSTEIIIVDDGSDDPLMTSSLADCERTGAGRIRILQQGNRGPGMARQFGFEHATGEFIQFLDSDDLLYPTKFELQVDALNACPEASIAYGKTRNLSQVSSAAIPWKRTGEKLDSLFPSILAGRVWDTSTALYRTAIVSDCGGWADLTNEEDWEFECRIAARNVRLAWIDDWVSEQRNLASNRVSFGGSSNPRKLADRAKARHSILESACEARVPSDAPEFQKFVRYSFLVARQCAAIGLVSEAKALVEHLNEIAPRIAMSFYLMAGKCLGFKRATRIAESVHSIVHPT